VPSEPPGNGKGGGGIGGGGAPMERRIIVHHLLSLSFRHECTTMKSKRKAKFRRRQIVIWRKRKGEIGFRVRPSVVERVFRNFSGGFQYHVSDAHSDYGWEESCFRRQTRPEMGLPPKRRGGKP